MNNLIAYICPLCFGQLKLNGNKQKLIKMEIHIEESIDINDYACSTSFTVKEKCECPNCGKDVTLETDIDVNDYFNSLCIDVEFDVDVDKDTVLEYMDDQDILYEAENRGLIKSGYNELNFNIERKRFYCELLNVSYHTPVNEILNIIREQITNVKILKQSA